MRQLEAMKDARNDLHNKLGYAFEGLITELQKEINKVIDEKILALKDGLVLISGITGSGKSTTLANIIEKFNENKSIKILTIEDPIEYIFENKKALIIQRELRNRC